MKIGIVGMGNMGKAIAASLGEYDLVCVGKGEDLSVADCEIVLLAVKPQQLDSVELSLRDDQILVSILAGTFTDKLRAKFGGVKIVRLMPNLCSKIGRSINVYFTSDIENVSEIESVFECFGKPFRLESENDFSTVTPVFGAGPAHLLYFLRAFKNFGSLDFDEALLLELMESTAVWAKGNGMSFDEMISAVSSKGGVTEKIHQTWDELGLDSKIIEGLEVGKKKEENF